MERWCVDHDAPDTCVGIDVPLQGPDRTHLDAARPQLCYQSTECCCLATMVLFTHQTTPTAIQKGRQCTQTTSTKIAKRPCMPIEPLEASLRL